MKKLYTAKNINVDIYQVDGVRQFELFLCKFAQPKSIIITSYGFETQKQSSSKKKCFDIDHFFIDLTENNIYDIKLNSEIIPPQKKSRWGIKSNTSLTLSFTP